MFQLGNHSLKIFEVAWFLGAAACFVSWSCASHPPPSELAAAPAVPSATATPGAALPSPPNNDEVHQVVTRVFKDAATLNSNRNPAFLTGDFNGDQYSDVAIFIKSTSTKLDEMNREAPPWILKDPLLSRPAQPAQIAVNESLLAIVHGYGPEGWRNPQATQTYLLKNVTGSDATKQSKQDFIAANQGKPVPRVVGDLMAQRLRGRPGFLYFNGASYLWYDPGRFRPEPELRLVHSRAGTRPANNSMFNFGLRKQAIPAK